MSKPTRQIPSLDGLRAISFLLVFIAHAGLERWVPGGLGVTIFFFLSGFLITTLMRSEYEKNAAINFRHLWLRRGLRILPTFYIVLLAASVVSIELVPDSFSFEPLAAQAVHYSNYWIIVHGAMACRREPAFTGRLPSRSISICFFRGSIRG